MNTEKQRIAIAEACGKWPSGWPHDYMNQADRLRHIPDYLNDLNAMHEAEKVLSDKQWMSYAHHLFDITHPHDDCGSFEWIVRATSHATATERAEAFLRTIGKWEDEA